MKTEEILNHGSDRIEAEGDKRRKPRITGLSISQVGQLNRVLLIVSVSPMGLR